MTGTPGAYRGPGCTILVVEDHPINRRLAERLLAGHGHRVVHAANGAQALERLAERAFHLVLMDCQMPVLDGYETTRRWRRREAETGGHVPIVAVTADAMPRDRERCLSAGMDDHLAKPISQAGLAGLLARWLPRRFDRDELLDPARMAELRELFAGRELTEMIAGLQADVNQQLRRLAEALDAGQPGQAAQAAHRIRGCAQVIGARLLAEAAGRMQVGAAGDLRLVAPELELVRMEWQAISRALDQERLNTIAARAG